MVSNLKTVGGGGGEAILGPEALLPRLLVRGSEHEHGTKFSPEPRLPFVSARSLSLIFISLFLFLARTRRAPRAHTTRPIRTRVCVSQRVRVISRLERLQVREEAANV